MLSVDKSIYRRSNWRKLMSKIPTYPKLEEYSTYGKGFTLLTSIWYRNLTRQVSSGWCQVHGEWQRRSEVFGASAQNLHLSWQNTCITCNHKRQIDAFDMFFFTRHSERNWEKWYSLRLLLTQKAWQALLFRFRMLNFHQQVLIYDLIYGNRRPSTVDFEPLYYYYWVTSYSCFMVPWLWGKNRALQWVVLLIFFSFSERSPIVSAFSGACQAATMDFFNNDRWNSDLGQGLSTVIWFNMSAVWRV
jgi:hypothetical protein